MKSKILIVDDSRVSAHFFKNVLEEEDHTVIISPDGKNIVELVEKNGIDIVLLDIIMPDADGYEILEILLKADITRDVPVIMITSLDSPMDVKKALDSGALDFIRKTSEPIEVIARVNSALRLKRKQDLLKHMAQKDPLTQLYNKQYFNTALEKLIANKNDYPKGIALLMMDCDFFKRINDDYGHVFGDTVLATVANAINKSVKSTDIICRFGGEEFSVISPNTTVTQAFKISERVRKNIEKICFVYHQETVSITLSCGISHTGQKDQKTGLKLVDESDSALYSAKSKGRNQTVVYLGESPEPKLH